MLLLDRYIIFRFLGNFALLFSLLFVFAISIDVVVQFDEFIEAAESVAEREGRWIPVVFVEGGRDFHGVEVWGPSGFHAVEIHTSFFQ